MVFNDAKIERVLVVFWRSKLLDDCKFKVLSSKFDLDAKHNVTIFLTQRGPSAELVIRPIEAFSQRVHSSPTL